MTCLKSITSHVPLTPDVVGWWGVVSVARQGRLHNTVMQLTTVVRVHPLPPHICSVPSLRQGTDHALCHHIHVTAQSTTWLRNGFGKGEHELYIFKRKVKQKFCTYNIKCKTCPAMWSFKVKSAGATINSCTQPIFHFIRLWGRTLSNFLTSYI